ADDQEPCRVAGQFLGRRNSQHRVERHQVVIIAKPFLESVMHLGERGAPVLAVGLLCFYGPVEAFAQRVRTFLAQNIVRVALRCHDDASRKNTSTPRRRSRLASSAAPSCPALSGCASMVTASM